MLSKGLSIEKIYPIIVVSGRNSASETVLLGSERSADFPEIFPSLNEMSLVAK